MIKRSIISFLLILMMLIGTVPFSVMAADLTDNKELATVSASTAYSLPYQRADGLYAYAGNEVSGTNAWQRWDSVNSKRYFYLPSTASDNEVIILNTYSSSVTLNGVTIPAGEYAAVPYVDGTTYTCSGATTQSVKIQKSDSEGTIFLNSKEGMVTVNDNSSKTETTINDATYDIYSFLTGNTKNREVKNIAGAVASVDNGIMEDTLIKKVKGRGNTTWDLDKKPFNITYKDNIQLDGMKGKKWSLLANAQDSSLMRNRLMYDISHEVGMVYACDSRFVDMFVNGDYKGLYQFTQKIELGKNTVMPDLEEPIVEEEVDEDTGETLTPPTSDFDFVLEIDMAEKAASAGDLTFYSSRGQLMTHKVPDEPTSAQVSFMKKKYNAFEDALYRDDMQALEKLIDIEDLARAYLINEIAKNLDGALTSCYFVYNSDTGMFYASPVWDYDNGLGNTIGIADRKDINGNVLYITSPSGWYTREVIHIDGNFDKSGNGRTVFSQAWYMKSKTSENKTFAEIAKRIWAEDFADLEEILTGNKASSGKRLKSIEEYKSNLTKSGKWNYSYAGWKLNNSTNNSWISDHSSVSIYKYDVKTDTLTKTKKSYDQTSFEGQVEHACDWLLSRFNWLNSEFTEVNTEVEKPVGETVTIYFAKDSDWSDAYIYAFYGSEGGTPTSEWTAAYPGDKMTFVEVDKQGNSIYSAKIPSDIDFIKFADGSSTNRRTDNVSNSEISDGVCYGVGDSVGTNKWDVALYEYTPAVTSFNVVFKNYDGTVLSEQTVENGKSAVAPQNPTREGDAQYSYTFKEWDTEYTNITADTVITAVYTQTVNKFTVTFKDYDGTELSQQTVEYGTDAVAPEVPAREGYKFTGWDKDFSCITGDLVVTAKYSKIVVPATTGKLKVDITGGTGFTISVNGGAARPQGTMYSNTKMSIGATVTLVANDVAGVEFLGWVNDAGVTLSAEKAYTFLTTGNDYAKAMYKTPVDGVNVVMFKNDKAAGNKGHIIDMQYYAAEDEVIFPDAPSQAGYDFAGWSMTAEDIKAKLTAGEDVTVLAVWTLAKVYVDVAVNGGIIDTEAQENGKYLAYYAVTAVADAAPAGMKFAYWTDAEGNILSYKSTYKFYPAASVELTAVYVAEDEAVELTPIVTLAANPTTEGEKITYILAWDVDNSAVGTVTALGIIIVDKADYNADTFVHGTTDAKVFDRAFSNRVAQSGEYSATKTGSVYDHTYVAAMWLTYTDATTGEAVTVYSDAIEVYKPAA